MQRNQPHKSAVEIAINAYWDAIAEWQKAHRKKDALAKKLSGEIMRQPRVVTSRIVNDPRNPVPCYATSQWEIDNAIERERAAYSHLNCDKRKFAARLRKRRRYLYDALEADRVELYALQTVHGWRQAVEAEDAARTLVCSTRWRVSKVKPESESDALDLIAFVRRAVDLNNRRNIVDAPYGLGGYYTRRILDHALEALATPSATAVRRAA